MNNSKIRLIGFITFILIFNSINLFSLTYQICSEKFFEEDKYLESKISYDVDQNNNMYLFEIDCFSTEQLIGEKDIFLKQAVAELVRKSPCYHITQDYYQTIFVPSCLSLESNEIDSVDFHTYNKPGYYKEYTWVNHFSSCDITKWDRLVMHLTIVNGRVVILSNVKTPQICMNVPPTCTPASSLLNTFAIMSPDWNVNPPYSTVMPIGSHFTKDNVLHTYTEGRKNINYMNIYEEYSYSNSLN